MGDREQTDGVMLDDSFVGSPEFNQMMLDLEPGRRAKGNTFDKFHLARSSTHTQSRAPKHAATKRQRFPVRRVSVRA